MAVNLVLTAQPVKLMETAASALADGAMLPRFTGNAVLITGVQGPPLVRVRCGWSAFVGIGVEKHTGIQCARVRVDVDEYGVARIPGKRIKVAHIAFERTKMGRSPSLGRTYCRT